MSVTKAQLVVALTEEIGLNATEAREFVDLFFEEIRRQLEQGKNVKLSGFGNFIVRHKRERPGRNPVTGQGYRIEARTVVRFQPGEKLVTQVNALTPVNQGSLGQTPTGPAVLGEAGV